MRESQMAPTRTPREPSTLVGVFCRVALMAVVAGSVFAGPGAIDRAVRQTRAGALRPVGGMRPDGVALDDRFTADEIDSRLPPDELDVVDRKNVSAQERQLSRSVADVPSAAISSLSLRPAASAPPSRSAFTGRELFTSPGSRGPPTA